jgi:antitoxin ParD1/3/4
VNVNLTPELEELIQRKVRSGLYRSQSEVVREALRLMAEHDQRRAAALEHLRGALAEGLEQADRGELLDGSSAISELRSKVGRGS